MKPTKTDDPNATARRADHQNKQSNNLNQSDIVFRHEFQQPVKAQTLGIEPMALGQRRRPLPPDTTMVVAPMPSRLTSEYSVAAFDGCSRMQPWEAGPPSRLIS